MRAEGEAKYSQHLARQRNTPTSKSKARRKEGKTGPLEKWSDDDSGRRRRERAQQSSSLSRPKGPLFHPSPAAAAAVRQRRPAIRSTKQNTASKRQQRAAAPFPASFLAVRPPTAVTPWRDLEQPGAAVAVYCSLLPRPSSFLFAALFPFDGGRARVASRVRRTRRSLPPFSPPHDHVAGFHPSTSFIFFPLTRSFSIWLDIRGLLPPDDSTDPCPKYRLRITPFRAMSNQKPCPAAAASALFRGRSDSLSDTSENVQWDLRRINYDAVRRSRMPLRERPLGSLRNPRCIRVGARRSLENTSMCSCAVHPGSPRRTIFGYQGLNVAGYAAQGS